MLRSIPILIAAVAFSAWAAPPEPPAFAPPAALHANASTDLGDDRAAHLATDGSGTWVAAWHSDETLGTIGTDRDILVARSTNGGDAWSDPVPLNTDAASDSRHDEEPWVATDGFRWVATWHGHDLSGGPLGTDFDILVARSDDGLSWTAPTALNTNAAFDAGSDLGGSLATDGPGAWVAAWSSGDSLDDTIGTDLDILVARSPDGQSWSGPLPLNTNAGEDAGGDDHVQLAVGGGTWVAVWESYDSLGGTIGSDGDILFARSFDGGSSWSDPVPIDSGATLDAENDVFPRVATDGRGSWIAVWRKLAAGVDQVLAAWSSDDGIGWTSPVAIDAGEGGSPTSVATDGSNWLATWITTDPFDGDRDLRVIRSTDLGASWSEPAALNSNAETDDGGDFDGQLDTDGQGYWVAVWNSSSSLGGAIGADHDILFATTELPEPRAWILCLTAIGVLARVARRRPALAGRRDEKSTRRGRRSAG